MQKSIEKMGYFSDLQIQQDFANADLEENSEYCYYCGKHGEKDSCCDPMHENTSSDRIIFMDSDEEDSCCDSTGEYPNPDDDDNLVYCYYCGKLGEKDSCCDPTGEYHNPDGIEFADDDDDFEDLKALNRAYDINQMERTQFLDDFFLREGIKQLV